MSGHICMPFLITTIFALCLQQVTAVTIGLNFNWKFGKDPWQICGSLVQCRPSFLKYKLEVIPYNRLIVSFNYSYSVSEDFPENCTSSRTAYCPIGFPFLCKVFTTTESNFMPCCNAAFHPTCRYTVEQSTTSATATTSATTPPATANIGVIITAVVMPIVFAIILTVVAVFCHRKIKRAVLAARHAENLRLNGGLMPPAPEHFFINSFTWYCRRLLTQWRNSRLPADQLDTEEISTAV